MTVNASSGLRFRSDLPRRMPCARVWLQVSTISSTSGQYRSRCAPIQAGYLGYPGTTGADYMDYVIADKVVVPPDARRHFTEKLVYLPHSYQVNDSQRAISDRMFTREEARLPATGSVFCCFNNNQKILPQVFDSWMRILQGV